VIILDQLEELYVPVRFDHETHARMTEITGDCTICHHYTPAGEEHPACRGCHPSEIVHEDLAKPGLKGAYHRQCLGCHTEWDRETACEVCHEKKAGGRLHGTATDISVHSHYTPLRLEELILFSTEYEEGDQVPFHHRHHSERYEPDCAVCHREQSCTQCHTQSGAVHPMGDPAVVDLHEYCFRCHREEDDPCHPEDACSHCHGRSPDDLFSHGSVGWPLAAYHEKLACGDCHGPWTASARPDRSCASCHRQGWSAASFDHRVTGIVLDEIHVEADCADCHGAGFETKPTCTTCHDDGRVYSKATGFGG
jgi:hypothetical protein